MRASPLLPHSGFIYKRDLVSTGFLARFSAYTFDGILSKNLFVEHGHSEPLAYLLRRAGHISSTLAGWTVAAPVNPQT